MDPNKKSILEVNKAKLTEYIEVHPDDIKAIDATLNELFDMGVDVIDSIEILALDTWGWELLLVNSDKQVFYLILSEYGCISIVRKDGLEGEILQVTRCGVMQAEPYENKEK